jgi:hypothetical protein
MKSSTQSRTRVFVSILGIAFFATLFPVAFLVPLTIGGCLLLAFCVVGAVMSALALWSGLNLWEGPRKEKLVCDFFGWHVATAEKVEFVLEMEAPGKARFSGTCDRCGKPVVAEDGKGNLFTAWHLE